VSKWISQQSLRQALPFLRLNPWDPVLSLQSWKLWRVTLQSPSAREEVQMLQLTISEELDVLSIEMG